MFGPFLILGVIFLLLVRHVNQKLDSPQDFQQDTNDGTILNEPEPKFEPETEPEPEAKPEEPVVTPWQQPEPTPFRETVRVEPERKEPARSYA